MFVDDVGMAALNTVENDELTHVMLRQPHEALSGLGAPVEVFLVSDLLSPAAVKSVDWARFKLCIFPNAMAVPPNTSAAITALLKRPGVASWAPSKFAPFSRRIVRIPTPRARISSGLGCTVHTPWCR